MYLYFMVWTGVIGQQGIKKQLEQLLTSGQVPHAQLFTGLPGYGGLALSIEFGLTLLGEISDSITKKPLGEKIQLPDFHFVFPVVKRGNEKVVFSSDYSLEWSAFLNESPYGNYNDWFESINVGNKQGIIGVNEIEKLHRKMHLKSYSGGNKVCVIWGVEKMNKEASNAFLKLLEEPPQKTYFVLVAEDSEMLLPTLLSRCQQISIPPIEDNELGSTLSHEIEDKDKLVSQAEGDFRRLQGLLQNSNNKEHEALLIKGLRTAFKAKGNKGVVIDLMQWSGELGLLGREDQKAFLNFGIQFFRDAFLLNYSLTSLVHFRSENNFDMNKLAPFVNSENIQDLISLFDTSHYHILRNANAKMIFAELGLQLTRLLNKSTT